jgi:hypothetical protein
VPTCVLPNGSTYSLNRKSYRPLGRAAAAVQPPLIGECRALGGNLMNAGKQCQRGKDGVKFSIHAEFQVWRFGLSRLFESSGLHCRFYLSPPKKATKNRLNCRLNWVASNHLPLVKFNLVFLPGSYQWQTIRVGRVTPCAPPVGNHAFGGQRTARPTNLILKGVSPGQDRD